MTQQWRVVNGNCVEALADMSSQSVDAVVTDPPYGLSFMGKEWDHSVPSAAVWREVLRVLKPGGHLLTFAGTRTQHRMACNIEDAGFEIRDMLAWVYGSGFPKSLDVSKAIDKAAGAEREVTDQRMGDVGIQGGNFAEKTQRGVIELRDTPATESAKKWQGWGTALKPALEPITMARKPLAGTVAANVLEHETGAINVDECRVEVGDETISQSLRDTSTSGEGWNRPWMQDKEKDLRRQEKAYAAMKELGRWPANVLHDGSEDVDAVLGEAKRFFYCPKASRKERGEGNNHPTVKPVELMRYLVRLVTPPGGLVLDPFCGSGTTGIACKLEGFAFHGIELNPEYAALAEQRIAATPDCEPLLFTT